MFAGNSVWYLITQSDLVSWMVLIILSLMSIACWAVFFGKYLITRTKLQQLHNAQKHLATCVSLHDLEAYAARIHNSLPWYIITKQKTALTLSSDRDTELSLLVSQGEQTIDTLMAHEERSLPFISTCAAVSPLLGLFGTVWGLIQAFIGISERQAADIVAVAPGIAQALITTLAGLVVAIPAFALFHYLQARVQLFEQELISFVNALNLCMQRIMRKE